MQLAPLVLAQVPPVQRKEVAAGLQLAVRVTLLPSVIEASVAVRVQVGGNPEGAVTVNGKPALPPLVVTMMLPAPIDAVAGTLVVIEVALMLVIAATTPPMDTDAPVKFVPVTVMFVPTAPLDGDTEVIVGGVATGGATVTVALAVLPAPAALLPLTV